MKRIIHLLLIGLFVSIALSVTHPVMAFGTSNISIASVTCNSVVLTGNLDPGEMFDVNFFVFDGSSIIGSMVQVASSGPFTITLSYTAPVGSSLQARNSSIGANAFTSPACALGSGAAFTDGRCNQQADQTFAVYPDNKGGYNFYAVNAGVGSFAMHITKQQLNDNPDKGVNYLIAESNGVQLYRLAGGGLQVNRAHLDHKLYTFMLGTCGATQD